MGKYRKIDRMNEYGDENQDYNIMLPSGGRRRSSMFDPDGEMMQKRKSRLDSMVSFSSDTDFDKMMTAMPKRRESRLAYENTYQLEPTEKPNLRQIQNAIYEVINTTCQDLEYEYISPCDVIKNVNQGRSQATESTCAASIQVHVPIIYARACRQRLANTIKVAVEQCHRLAAHCTVRAKLIT